MEKTSKPKDVDAYIAAAPKQVQGKLKEIRKAIKDAAPNALERISYGMPYYHYKGRLAYFSHWKEHIGLYIPTPIVAEHQDELKAYKTTKATIQFPLDKKLPIALVKKLVRARMKKSDAPKKRLKLVSQ
jgi:uncharacterized protein YdhG (YjbR/CyaY superfamily)